MAKYSLLAQRAIARQKKMAGLFTDTGFPSAPRYIAGADIAFVPSTDPAIRTAGVGSIGIAVAVVLDLQTRTIVQAAYARRRITFPYIPGLLSFREAPLLLAALRKLTLPIDVYMFDGTGRAHPRGVGLATHMGILLDVPTIGVAKSILIGKPEPLATQAGASARVMHKETAVAVALRTRATAEPIYISQGHRCTLEQAVALTELCLDETIRLPIPTHVADALTKQYRAVAASIAQEEITTLAFHQDQY